MKESILKKKSFLFSIKIVNLYKLIDERNKYLPISTQLLRCGTSIGAMISEVAHAESANDFVHKLSVAQKEVNEVLYWLDLLVESNYITLEELGSSREDAVEIQKMITSSIKTVKQKLTTHH